MKREVLNQKLKKAFVGDVIDVCLRGDGYVASHLYHRDGNGATILVKATIVDIEMIDREDYGEDQCGFVLVTVEYDGKRSVVHMYWEDMFDHDSSTMIVSMELNVTIDVRALYARHVEWAESVIEGDKHVLHMMYVTSIVDSIVGVAGVLNGIKSPINIVYGLGHIGSWWRDDEFMSSLSPAVWRVLMVLRRFSSVKGDGMERAKSIDGGMNVLPVAIADAGAVLLQDIVQLMMVMAYENLLPEGIYHE